MKLEAEVLFFLFDFVQFFFYSVGNVWVQEKLYLQLVKVEKFKFVSYRRVWGMEYFFFFGSRWDFLGEGDGI